MYVTRATTCFVFSWQLPLLLPLSTVMILSCLYDHLQTKLAWLCCDRLTETPNSYFFLSFYANFQKICFALRWKSLSFIHIFQIWTLFSKDLESSLTALSAVDPFLLYSPDPVHFHRQRCWRQPAHPGVLWPEERGVPRHSPHHPGGWDDQV